MSGTLQTFAGIIGPLRLVAHELGYAVAVHGSLKRDIDLVAIPWTRNAVDRDELVKAICERLGAFRAADGWRERPHGRWVQIIRIPDQNPYTYLDLSIMELRP
jgi:hypothetical protein